MFYSYPQECLGLKQMCASQGWFCPQYAVAVFLRSKGSSGVAVTVSPPSGNHPASLSQCNGEESSTTHSSGTTRPISHQDGTQILLTTWAQQLTIRKLPVASTHCHIIYTADGSWPWLRNLALEDSPSNSQRAYSPRHTRTHACGDSNSGVHSANLPCVQLFILHVYLKVGGQTRAGGIYKT